MKSVKSVAPILVGASILLALAACEGPDTATSAAAKPEAESTGGKIVYSETFSDSGLFQVMSDPSGEVTFAIKARIGSRAEELMNASASEPTLADVYRSLHGGSGAIPAEVASASAQLADSRPAQPALPETAPAAIPLAKTASESAFKSNYCIDIRELSYVWRWQTCDWAASVNYISTPFVDAGYWGSDRVYAWNNTAYTAKLQLWNTYKTAHPNSWTPSLQPYWVTWFQWGGNYSFAIADMTLPAGRYGELGLSTHRPEAIVK